MSLHAKPREIFGPVYVEPRRSQFDAEPATRQRLDRIAERGAGRPPNALEHSRGYFSAGDRVEPAVVHRAEGYIGRAGQQSADVRRRQPWRIAAEDHCLRPSRRQRMFESSVDSFTELAGALHRTPHGKLTPGLRWLIGGEFHVRIAAKAFQHGQCLANERGMKIGCPLGVDSQPRLHTPRRRRFRE